MIKILITVLAAYVIYACGFFLLQREVLFPRRYLRAPGPDLERFPELQQHWLRVGADRVELWYLPPIGSDSGPHPVAIIAHGNANVIDTWPERLEGLRKLGIGVALVEYPGYGRSEGSPSLVSVHATMVEAWNWTRSRDFTDPDRIILLGRSMGGGAVLSLLPRHRPAAIVLMSTYTTIREFAWRYGLPPFMVRDPFDNEAALRSYDGPVHITHGTRDRTVPFSHGERLQAAAPQAEFLQLGCGHNDCPPNWDDYWQRLGEFFREHGILAQSGLYADTYTSVK